MRSPRDNDVELWLNTLLATPDAKSQIAKTVDGTTSKGLWMKRAIVAVT